MTNKNSKNKKNIKKKTHPKKFETKKSDSKEFSFESFFTTERVLFLIGLFILVISHNQWFTDVALTGGDWGYGYREWVLEYLRPFYIWKDDNGLGFYNPLLSTNGLFLFQGIVALFGASFEIAQRVTVFWPSLILPYIGAYLLFKYIYKNAKFAVVAGLVASMMPRILMAQSGHVTQVVVYGLTLVAMYFLIRSYKENKSSHLLTSALLISMSFSYTPRLGFVSLMIVYTYFLVELFYVKTFEKFFQLFRYAIIFLTVVVLINSYWIFPFFLGGGKNAAFSLAAPTPWYSRDRIIHGLFHTHPDWTWETPSIFQDNTPAFYFFLLPIFAFITGFSLDSYKDKKKYTLFFILLALVGIFFHKQENPPLGFVYTWMFYNVPLFSAFRESSKFYYIIVTAYSILVPLGLLYITDLINRFNGKKFSRKNIENSVIAFAVVYICIIVKPVFFNEIKGTITGEQFDKNYLEYNKVLQEMEEPFVRQVWFPDTSRYTPFSAKYPILSKQGLGAFDAYRTEGFIQGYLKNPFFYEFLKIGGIKYLGITDNSVGYSITNYRPGILYLLESNSKFHNFKPLGDYDTYSILETDEFFPRIYLTNKLVSFYGPVNRIQHLARLVGDLEYFSLDVTSGLESEPKGDVIVLAPGANEEFVTTVIDRTVETLRETGVDNFYVLDVPVSGEYEIFYRREDGLNFFIYNQDGTEFEFTGNSTEVDEYFNSLGEVYLDKGTYSMRFEDSDKFQPIIVTERGYQRRHGRIIRTPITNDENIQNAVTLSNDAPYRFATMIVTLTNIDAYSRYNISFDALFNSNDTKAVLEIANPSDGSLDLYKTIKQEIRSSDEWRRYEFDFVPQYVGKNDMFLNFKIKTNEGIDPEEIEEISALRIANLTVKKLAEPNVLFVKGDTSVDPVQTAVEFQKIDPTKYVVKIDGTEGYKYINFSESFDESWEIYKSEGEEFRTEESYQHNLLNVKEYYRYNKIDPNVFKEYEPAGFDQFSNFGFFNAWEHKGDDTEFVIFYDPQRKSYMGWVITIISTVSVIGSIIFLKVRNAKRTISDR